MKKKSLVIITYILLTGIIYISKGADSPKKIITSVHFTLGYPAANNNSTEFFNVYQEELNGLEKNFTFPAIAGLSIKVKYPKIIRFGIDAHYQYIDMQDHYTEQVDFGYKQGSRQITQEFSLTTRAVYAIIEYIPIISQFRTYAGAGFGANFGRIFWTERINSDIRGDIRVGGNHVDNSQITPAIKFYTGLELGFDKEKVDDYLGSVFFEIMYINLFRYEKIFQDVYDQISDPSESLLDSYNMASSYVSFNIGVSFNVDIFKINK